MTPNSDISQKQYSIDFDSWDFSTNSKEIIDNSNDDTIEQTITNNQIYYMSFGSGSSGNSCYIGTSDEGIIIDAGVKADNIVAQLRANGVSMDKVKAICLTHDHADHVRYAYNMVRKHKHLKVYCTNRVLNGILRKHNVSKRVKDYHIPIFKEIPFIISNH